MRPTQRITKLGRLGHKLKFKRLMDTEILQKVEKQGPEVLNKALSGFTFDL